MKNIKIRFKLLLLAGFLMAGLIAMGIVSLVFMGQINNGTTVVSENWMPSVIAAEDLNTLTSDYRIQEYRHILSEDSATMQAAETEMSRISGEINALFDRYLTSLITNDTDGQLMRDAQTAWNKYLELHDNMISLSSNNRTAEAMRAIQDSDTLFDEASATFLACVDFNKAGADQANLDGNELYASAETIVVAVLVVVCVLSLVFAIYIIRSINSPVKELDQVATKIAAGDLDQSIKYRSRDELGKLAINFNKTVDRLRDYVKYIDEISSVLNQIADGNLVFELSYDYAGEFAKVKRALEQISASLNNTLGQINQSADQVASGSDQVSSGSQALSQGATEQASSVEELAATISEISAQVKETASNANEARRQSDETGEQVASSNQQMQEMISAIDEISEKSGQISKIIKTIEDIAFQTNILALNAAVEAARAGAAGKGFAVVADEVRNLASKSSEASKSTAALIEGTVLAVEKGTGIASATAQSLNSVVESTKKVVDSVEKIAFAAEQQATSIAQVTQGIDQISSVVQTNSATAEESAAASEELSGQAQMLKSLVGQFKLRGMDNEAQAGQYTQRVYSEMSSDGKY